MCQRAAGEIAGLVGVVKAGLGQGPIGHGDGLLALALIAPLGAAQRFDLVDEIALRLDIERAVGIEQRENYAVRIKT